MKNEVKYKDYRIGRDVYTVKLTYLPQGGCFGPEVRVEVMKWHQPPRNLWERITEWWKYYLSGWEWIPSLTEASLDAYCIDKCNYETWQRITAERGDKEWEAL